MNAFAALDLHVLFFLDTRTTEVHNFMIEGANRALARMPSTFSSFMMAKKFWSLIMRRNYHFIKLALVKGQSELSCAPWEYNEMNAPWEDSANLFPGGNIFSTPKEPVLEMVPDSLQYRDDVKRWSRAAAPVFRNISATGTQEEKILCALLQMNQLMNEIMLQSIFFTNETRYDVFLPEWKRMLFLSQYLHPYMTGVAAIDTPYHFDLGIIPPLFLLGMRCRDKAIRDDVIEILSKVQYREGMWDSMAAVTFVEWVKEIEDLARDENGYVPEHKRAFVTSAYVDLEGRRAILSATQKTPSGRVFLEKIVGWG